MEKSLAKAGGQLIEPEDTMQMVGFIVAGELFGVDILTVQEIIKSADITEIPDSPAFIEGVINLRGNIIPIIDLHKRLKLPDTRGEKSDMLWIIIINTGDRIAGFVVDQVTRVVKVTPSMIKPAPELMVAGLKSDYIRGVCKQEQQMMAILDFDRILLVDEFKKLSAQRKQKAVRQRD